MITHLHIKNFTIADALELDFNDGMSVITGETGAGKSIMLDALSLCLGARADSKVVRHGSDRCEITASFDIKNLPAVTTWLEGNNLDAEGECILRRTITSEGRSKSYINGQPSPLQLTKSLGTLLVNIHGQHEHQTLLKRDHQRLILDAYGNHTKATEAVKTIYVQWRKALDELNHLNAQSNNQARIALLRYQVKELDELNLGANELDTLDKEHKQLASGDALIEDCQQAMNLCSEEETGSIIANLNTVVNLLETHKETNPKIQQALELTHQALINTDEALNEVKSCLENLSLDPERLSWVETRLENIFDIARKHHIKPTSLHELHVNLADELKQLAQSGERITQLEKEMESFTKDYLEKAKKLTKLREKTAKTLSTQISESIQHLGMPGGVLDIHFEPRDSKQLHPHGAEHIEFIVSANPGQPLQPLSKVASGGELSRISLAIQVNAAKTNPTPTLIFDEVDVGIGGGTAEMVGQLLRELGKHTQVMCVTHQPQVAALGHNHLCVAKSTKDNVTKTQIKNIDGEERTKEIARMLGGIKLTKQTLSHAKEMLAT